MISPCLNIRFAAVLLVCALLVSCNRDKDPQSAVNARKLAVTKLDTNGLEAEKYDLNNDGEYDQIRYVKKGTDEQPDQLRYVTHDINFDGIIDITEFFDDDGNHFRDEIDLDFDGVCDLIITYKNDLPVRKDYSVDFEGNRHGVQYFDEQGFLKEIRRDTDNDGKVDTIEYYHPNETEPYNIKKSSKFQNSINNRLDITENTSNSVDSKQSGNTNDNQPVNTSTNPPGVSDAP